MSERQLKLRLRPAGHKCDVILDGEPVTNCRKVTVNAECGKVTTVTLELINIEVEVDGDGLFPENIQIVDVTPITAANRIYRRIDVGAVKEVM